MAGIRGVNGGLLRRLRNLGFECIPLPGSGEALDESAFNSVVTCSVVGMTVTKTVATAAWDSGAISSQVGDGDCSVVFRASSIVGNKACGLTHDNSSPNQHTIDFALTLITNIIQIWENGGLIGAFGNFLAGDEFKVDSAAGVITYWQRTPPGAWALLYTSLVAPIAPLRVGISIYTQGEAINDVTLTGFTSYRRVASSLDYSRRLYSLAQAADGRRPAFVPGDPCKWRFEAARGDYLASAVVPLGANPYTVVVIQQLASLPGPGVFYCPWANGVAYTDGPALIWEPGGTLPLKLYHWGPALTVQIVPIADLLRHSYIVRWDGANCLARVDGADNAPVAIAACAAPTVRQVVGAGDATPNFPFDGNIELVAVATRSLSAGDMTELSAITLAGWGV